MLPSASLGSINANGKRAGMYEPVHGSAPDIAGQNKANPLAMIMSFAMMLKYSFDMKEDAVLIEQAVQNVLSKGLRTQDIKKDNENAVSTKEMGKEVIQELNILLGK
jgi:3-isopropylmalate dehydrogenase